MKNTNINSDEATKESWSCPDLHHSLFVAPNELRHCCKRFFVDGELCGDVPIFDISNDPESFSVARILQAKKKLHNQINQDEKTPCSGCPWLEKRQWGAFEQFELRHLSLEPHSVCNLRCSYCSDTYYGGKWPKYDLMELLAGLLQDAKIAKDLSVVWGGGEPTLLKNFDEIFSMVLNHFKPASNRVFSNAMIVNSTLLKYLKQGKVTMTTSIDAGTEDVFKLVRGKAGLYKVLENLRIYLENGAIGITIKYIFTNGNSSQDQVQKFINEIKSFNLTSCSFQISSDFKHEEIDDTVCLSCLEMVCKLNESGIDLLNIDDHLRPRLGAYLDKIGGPNQLPENLSARKYFASTAEYPRISIWGAGQYAMRMKHQCNLFRTSELVRFVDSDKRKIGKYYIGLKVEDPCVLINDDSFIWIASTQSHQEIIENLKDMGISEERIIRKIVL